MPTPLALVAAEADSVSLLWWLMLGVAIVR